MLGQIRLVCESLIKSQQSFFSLIFQRRHALLFFNDFLLLFVFPHIIKQLDLLFLLGQVDTLQANLTVGAETGAGQFRSYEQALVLLLVHGMFLAAILPRRDGMVRHLAFGIDLGSLAYHGADGRRGGRIGRFLFTLGCSCPRYNHLHDLNL